MKQLSLLIFLLFAVTNIFAQTQTQPAVQKTGYVDSGIIMQQFPEAVKASSDLEAMRIKFQKQVDSIYAVLQNEAADLQKKFNTMKPDAQRDAQQKLSNKEQALYKFRDDKLGNTGELMKKRDELLAPIKEKVFKAIEAIAKEEGFNFVIDNMSQVLLYSDNNFDITYKVLDRLKRGK